MARIDCRGGHTQIGKVLAHAQRETQKTKVQALVFVGDAMEEKLDDLCQPPASSACSASRPSCSRRATIRWPSRRSARSRGSPRGAYCRFDPGAAHELGELLRAAAAYAAGGMKALADLSARRDRRRHQAHRADEIAMPTLLFGVVVLSLVLLGLNAFSKADPHTVAVVLKAGGGIGALGGAAFLGLRGASSSRCRSGSSGLACSAGCRERPRFRFTRTQKSAGQVSRVRSAFLEMELDHDSGAMRGRILAGRHEAPRSTRSMLPRCIGLLTEIDEESRALLMAYLDRREPGWREHAQDDAAAAAEQRGGRAAK